MLLQIDNGTCDHLTASHASRNPLENTVEAVDGFVAAKPILIAHSLDDYDRTRREQMLVRASDSVDVVNELAQRHSLMVHPIAREQVIEHEIDDNPSETPPWRCD